MRRWTEYCQGERLPGMLLASTSAHARVGSTGRAIRALYQGTRRRTLDLVTQIPAHGVCALLVHMGVWHRVWTGTSAAAASVGPSEASAAIALGSSSRGGQLTDSPRTWLRTLMLFASYPTPPNGSQRLREEEERGMIHPRHSIHIRTHWENTAGA